MTGEINTAKFQVGFGVKFVCGKGCRGHAHVTRHKGGVPEAETSQESSARLSTNMQEEGIRSPSRPQAGAAPAPQHDHCSDRSQL